VTSIRVGVEPWSSTYDSADGEVYVSNSASSNVSVVDGTTVVGAVKVGFTPGTSAFDAGNGCVYVPNGPSDNVSIIAGTRIVGTVRVAVPSSTNEADPIFAVYDSSDGDVYVANYDADNVSVINGTRLIASLNSGSGPLSETYDSGNGYVYVANAGTVTVIDGLNVVATINESSGPGPMAYDSRNGYVYVPLVDSDNVSVLSGVNPVATIGVGYLPMYADYDSGNGYVYVSNEASANVSVISGTTLVGAVQVGDGPQAEAYDNGNGFMYVANQGESSMFYGTTVTVMNGTDPIATLNVSPEPVAVTYDSQNGEVYVAGWASYYVSAIPTAGSYPVVFTERGLPFGTNWSIDLGGIPEISSLSSLSYLLPNGTYSYTIGPVSGYTLNREPASITVSGANTTVSLTFTRVTYPVTFSEAGLSRGTTWSVNFSGIQLNSTSPTLSLLAPNGSYSFAIMPATGFEAIPDSGSLTIDGTARSVSILFARTFAVTFEEQGLPSGTNWSVTLDGMLRASFSPTIAFAEPNGTYGYVLGNQIGWESSNATESVTVHGSAVSTNITWVRIVYGVTFSEGGLPLGTLWSVKATSGSSAASNISTLSLLEPNGTYGYLVSDSDTTYAAPSGSFTVHGASVLVNLTFARVTYPVTFATSGLPAGARWWINVTGNPSQSSTTLVLAFQEPNGTYPYSTSTSDKTYRSTGGSFSVRGKSVAETAEFSLVGYAVTFVEEGLPSGTNWSVVFNSMAKVGTGALTFPGVANGTYAFTVGSVGDYTPSQNFGTVSVIGFPASVLIWFEPPATFLGLPQEEGCMVLGGCIAIVVVAVAVVILVGRRKRSPPDPAKLGTGGPFAPP
jgi:DNA-binding beta-propeller fold protein YncE